MRPAALVRPRVMIIGRVEVADQHPAEVLTQHFVHHFFAPAPPYKVALRGSAEGPDIAVDALFPPAGLVSMHYRTGPNPLPHRGYRSLGLLGGLVQYRDDATLAEVELIERVQQPLNGADGQSTRLPQGGNQAHQADAQTLLAHHQVA